MPTYMESEYPTILQTGSNGSGWGNGFSDGWWGIILLALLFGWGRNGNAFGGGNGYGGYATPASQADLAAGFANSEIMSDLNDILLSQSQGFAGVQQTLCQGFSGINTAILQSNNATERGFATTNYNMATGFSGLNQTIDKCCCDLKSMIIENRYLNEKQTSEVVQAINAGNQRLVDIYTNDKIDTLNRKLSVAENALNQCQNNAYLLGQIKPQPVPAYPVFPTTSFAYPSGVTFGINNNGCGGCGNGF